MPDRRPEPVRAFLDEGTRTAKLTAVSADGRPHVAPVSPTKIIGARAVAN